MTSVTHLTPIRRIIELTAQDFGVPAEEIVSDRRSQEITIPRQVAFYLARELTPSSLPAIGRVFHRDHTTILSGVNALGARMEADPLLAERVRRLRDEIAPAITEMSGLNRAAIRLQTQLFLAEDTLNGRVDAIFATLRHLLEKRPLAVLEGLEDLVLRLNSAEGADQDNPKKTGEET